MGRRQGVASIPVAPGTWVTAAGAGKLSILGTGDMLCTTRFPEALREFHKLTLGAIGRAFVENQKKLEERIAAVQAEAKVPF